MKIQLKRVYDPVSESDGMRILIDRLWPRGVKKGTVPIDLWIKEVSPSDELRKWFSHDPEKWEEFQKRYIQELEANRTGVASLVEAAKKGTVTLLYSSKKTEHNNAVCLKNYLESLVSHRR